MLFSRRHIGTVTTGLVTAALMTGLPTTTSHADDQADVNRHRPGASDSRRFHRGRSRTSLESPFSLTALAL